ncbi:MAG: D-sedoheptulose 7-phosphate isomerase [Paludibacteraceae bacterium]|nr:D-sedoheptulose 7-phosphate isomerase [Paludibacteraceae bacterium]
MDVIRQSIEDSIAVKTRLLENTELIATINSVADVLIDALQNGHRVLWCGNGGSAADAQHLAAELSGRFYFDRPPLNSEALHCNTSYLTAVANDYGYDLIYSRMIDGACVKGDVLVGISTSGNSANIYNAFVKAREIGVITVAFTGETGGKMKELSDYLINIPSTDTPRIQEAHILVGHAICQMVEAVMFKHD